MDSENSVDAIAESYWNNEIDDDERKMLPLPVASTDIVKISDKVYFNLSFGNITIIETNEGLVLIDAGIYDVGAILYERLVKHFPNKFVVTCIYTHGHIDHVEGLIPIQEAQTKRGGPTIKVIAHKNVNGRFDRYCLTCGYNEFINNKQFANNDDSLHQHKSFETFIRPHQTYGHNDDAYSFNVGEVHFQLRHFKGETDDATTVWVPELKVLCPGDLFIWNTPNCGNPQKVQRYPLEWANGLGEMAKFNAKYLLPGHGPYIKGSDRVKMALTDTSDFLHDLFDQTIKLINTGVSLNDIIYSIKFRKDLLEKPYLKPFYDHPEFIVRNIWRQYCGWYDFHLPNLFPESYKKVAEETSKIYKNLDHQLDHIKGHYEKNELKLALHFIEVAYTTYPTNLSVLELRKVILAKLMEDNTSLMARNIYRYDHDSTDNKISEVTQLIRTKSRL
ncbi:MAG: MBL fold metallo-hydrolase [Terrestrivirus sp.]|uniref:MBL fold metallo-hydrolase n=1 Tax=Terrestrivirus sp. TaxID=2487775 RepID=A0A3G4ZQM4_9VIRU|nr:MAG: MBL fold metallo-hydrolase [Terrestrivirus sp.]